MLVGVSETEKEDAIRYLMDNVPEECLNRVWNIIQNKEGRLPLLLNSNFGIYIRNTLRRGSFIWSPLILDALWYSLIKEASERKMHEKS